ncbi:MAG: formate/nitrite transporter family protein [Paracoccaceae bacterium]
MRETSFLDAYKPAQIAQLIETVGVNKAKLPAAQMLVLAILAGAFIGFGAAAYTAVMTGADASFGPSRLLGGIVFSLGLILVIVGGAELFTGNALMVMAAVDKRISVRLLLRNWVIVYFGNLVGALALASAFGLSGVLDQSMGKTAVALAEAKAALPVFDAFTRGILCNALVCLAIWLTFAARTVAGKILAILWPVSVFVLLGLEHSVANMFFFPQAWAAGAQVSLAAASTNLLFVTMGNVVGGGIGVAVAYRFAYLSSENQNE